MLVFKKVENTNKYRSAVPHYWYLKVGDGNYLFSDSQMITAGARAEKNPEDIPKTYIDTRWLFYFFGLLTGCFFTLASALLYS